VPVDPLAGEVVRGRDDEAVVRQLDRLDLAEPVAKRLLAERLAQSAGDVGLDDVRARLETLTHATDDAPSLGFEERRS